MLKKVLVGSCGVAAVWEAGVGYRRSRAPENEEFRIGTTDDLLMDNLKSGDLIFFTRHWTTEHLPFMLLHQLYKTSHNSEVDHCGILVQDGVGKLHVLERSYTGTKLRPFPARVNWSKARLILVRPRIDELSPKNRDMLWQYATQKCSEERSDWSYFWKQMKCVLTKLSRGHQTSDHSAGSGVMCQDTLLINEALKKAAVAKKESTEGFRDVKDLLEEQSSDYTDAAIPIRMS